MSKNRYDGFGSFNDQDEMSQASKTAKTKSKISPRVREQAAIYCSVMANWMAEDYNGGPIEHPCDEFDQEIVHIGSQAFAYFISNMSMVCDPTTAWAEAEALLRTGWEP